jgi:hypothetical protein
MHARIRRPAELNERNSATGLSRRIAVMVWLTWIENGSQLQRTGREVRTRRDSGLRVGSRDLAAAARYP